MSDSALPASRAPSGARTDSSIAYEERAFGFWLYLMSDAIIFALLFATYLVMLGNTAGGPAGKTLFDLSNTITETAFLLLSSLTYGFASILIRAGNKVGVLCWLIVTFVLGFGFVAVEFHEFESMMQAGGRPDRSGHLSSFFALVGTHGMHVSFGLLWILVMIGQVAVKGLHPAVTSRLFRLGLFWHFLDIIWIGIFSVVYLPGVM